MFLGRSEVRERHTDPTLRSQMDMEASSPFSEAFDFASGAIGERFQNPLWKLTNFFFGARLRSAVAEVKRFGRSIVETAVRKRAETNIDGGKTGQGHSTSDDPLSGSLINFLIDGIGDHEIVADAALNYLSAGRDTTAQSLTWTFYLLMRHPSIVRNIRNELNTLFPGLRTLVLSSNNLPQPSALPYTMAVFNESLRLYPPVPFEIKQCELATTLPDGTCLPRSSVVVWCTWAMNRSKITWGPDADCFRPERWLEEEVVGDSEDRHERGVSKQKRWKPITKTAFEYPVFHGGPRSCLGRKMAELLGVFVVASLVWEFDFAEGNGPGYGNERKSKNSLTLPMEEGLPCYVTSRRQVP
ncbi:MAG: hypothetical protein M1830_007575 [Pleopsidium flavum]|nr:MAG: hypothetical protein M1830_007575 [Pleopsidium flavum]